jgi:hypothetical protein
MASSSVFAAFDALRRRYFEHLWKTDLSFQCGFKYLLLKKDFRYVAKMIDIMLLNEIPYVDMVLMLLNGFLNLFQFAYLRISSPEVVL